MAKVIDISDLLEIRDKLKLYGLLATIDIQEAFDSVDYSFLISILERYEIGNRFAKLVKILLRNQESCIINGGNTTGCVKKKKKKSRTILFPKSEEFS